MCFAETWCTQPIKLNSKDWGEYDTYWANAIEYKSLGRASGGLVVLVKKDYKSILLDVSDSWIAIRIEVATETYVLIFTYFRYSRNIKHTLDLFRLALDLILEQHSAFPLVLMGDFNSKIGIPEAIPEEILSASRLFPQMLSPHAIPNERGRVLNKFMDAAGFVVLNGRMEGDRPARITFCSDVGATSIIDLAWVNAAGFEKISDFSVDHSVTLSDHFHICLELEWNPLCTNAHVAPAIPTASFPLSWDPDLASSFTSSLAQKPPQSIVPNQVSIDEMSQELSPAIKDTATDLGLFSR